MKSDMSERCTDCEAAARHANSDATTPGFFYDKCEKHRITTGFLIKITTHTKEAQEGIKSPEELRFVVGDMLDNLELDEEVDYTLEVRRTYE